MQDDIPTLFAFNRWANTKMFEACRKLTPDQYAAEPMPGWSSIQASVYHIVVVTEGWVRGLRADADWVRPTEAEVLTVDDAVRIVERAYGLLESLLATLTPEMLTTPRTFQRRNWTASFPPWLVLRHIVNHTSYHRGQVASKLKRFGIQQAETDMVYWAMELSQQQK